MKGAKRDSSLWLGAGLERRTANELRTRNEELRVLLAGGADEADVLELGQLLPDAAFLVQRGLDALQEFDRTPHVPRPVRLAPVLQDQLDGFLPDPASWKIRRRTQHAVHQGGNGSLVGRGGHPGRPSLQFVEPDGAQVELDPAGA